MAEATTTLLTGEDLLRMRDDGWRYELRRGELIRMPPPGFEHSDIGTTLVARLRPFAIERKLGLALMEAGFRLFADPDTVRAPDVSFVRQERLSGGRRPRGYFPGAPDLAVEVASPSESSEDINEKISEYLSAGTQLVVVLYPRTRQASLHRPDGSGRLLGDGDTLDLGEVVPGFTCPIAEPFAFS